MAIDIARRSEGPVDLKNGYGEAAWLHEVHPLVHGYKCVLKAGHDVSPKTYKDKTVVFIFSYGTGYITNGKKAYNIEGVCFFVPDFDHDKYTIHAAEDMEYMMVVVDMVESDLAAYEDTHAILPTFKRLEDCEEYTQSCKGPHTHSWSVIHKGNLARVLIGVVKAEGANEGTFEKGHPSVDQWNYSLPGADFELTVGDETIHQGEGEWSYVTTGVDHQLTGKCAFYVWFEHMTSEIQR